MLRGDTLIFMLRKIASFRANAFRGDRCESTFLFWTKEICDLFCEFRNCCNTHTSHRKFPIPHVAFCWAEGFKQRFKSILGIEYFRGSFSSLPDSSLSALDVSTGIPKWQFND